jgi:hypothetical protein
MMGRFASLVIPSLHRVTPPSSASALAAVRLDFYRREKGELTLRRVTRRGRPHARTYRLVVVLVEQPAANRARRGGGL